MSEEEVENVSGGAAKKTGLGVVTTTFFLAGTMAGSGVLALPLATVKAGSGLFIGGGPFKIDLKCFQLSSSSLSHSTYVCSMNFTVVV